MFRYYFVNRPPFYRARPDGAVQFSIWTPTQPVQDLDNRYFHGWADFPAQLPFDVIWKWDLLPAAPAERKAYLDWVPVGW